MIQNTRIASDDEKSLILQYIVTNYYSKSPPTYSLESWKNASFIVLEVQNLDSKIVVVNKIANDSNEILNIISAYYLLFNDNTIQDIND